METAWELVETCIQPIITYGGETWKINKKEERTLNQIQENIIKRILMTPQSTPAEVLYMETGLLDITTIILKNRLNLERRLRKTPNYLATKIMEQGIEGGWKATIQEMKTKSNIQNGDESNTGKINKHDINNYFKTKIENLGRDKSKVKHLISNRKWNAGERPKYINKMTRTEASLIFKTRTRMLEVKNNYKNKYTSTECRKCKQTTETQEHILTECMSIHTNCENKVNMAIIYSDNITQLKEETCKIKNIMKMLETEDIQLRTV